MTANADMTPTVGEGRHLPECDTPHNGLLPCICEPLRACEERVEESMDRAWTHMLRLKQAEAYASGVQAARKAVQRVGIQPEPVQQYAKSLAAINALRANNT